MIWALMMLYIAAAFLLNAFAAAAAVDIPCHATKHFNITSYATYTIINCTSDSSLFVVLTPENASLPLENVTIQVVNGSVLPNVRILSTTAARVAHITISISGVRASKTISASAMSNSTFPLAMLAVIRVRDDRWVRRQTYQRFT